MMAMAIYQYAVCQKSFTFFLSSTKCPYTSILFGNVEYLSYLCIAFRIVGNGRPTHERKEPTVSTAMCDERESGERAAFLLPSFHLGSRFSIYHNADSVPFEYETT